LIRFLGVAAILLTSVSTVLRANEVGKPWKVERGTLQCSMTKPDNPKFEVEVSDSHSGPSLLAMRFGSSEFLERPGEIVLLPSGKSFTRKSGMWIPGGYAITGLPDDFLSELAQSTGLIINVDGKKKFEYRFGAPGEGVRTLEYCHDLLLRSWGIDQTRARSLKTPAIPMDEGRPWVRDEEFGAISTEAMARYGGGTTVISYTVQTDGRVADCRTVVSSGLPTLDAFACSSVSKRGRFEPAINSAGEPVTQRIADIYRFAFTRP